MDSIGNFGNTYVLVTRCTFASNSAIGPQSALEFALLGGLGGALRIFAAVLWVDGSKLTHNLADSVGGAIFFNQSCALVSHLGINSSHSNRIRQRKASLCTRLCPDQPCNNMPTLAPSTCCLEAL